MERFGTCRIRPLNQQEPTAKEQEHSKYVHLELDLKGVKWKTPMHENEVALSLKSTFKHFSCSYDSE